MRDINTYIKEGFYKNVGADFTFHKENFEKLKKRIYNTTGYAQKPVLNTDKTRKIFNDSYFNELPVGTIITLPLPASDYNGPRGKRYKCTLTKTKMSPVKDDMIRSKWNSDIDEIGWHKTSFNDLGVFMVISRAENFLERDELDSIKIEFSIQ